MKSFDQINKIQAVVLYVLRKFQNGVDYIKLFKIIYFAQREFLSSFGKELIPETFKARKFGPIPTLTNKVIKRVEEADDMLCPDLKDFESSIRVCNQLVSAVSDPDMDYLSKKECQCLDKWFDLCKDKDSKNELSEESHDEAYITVLRRMEQDPQQDVLTRIDIAKAGKASDKIINYIREKELLTEMMA